MQLSALPCGTFFALCMHKYWELYSVKYLLGVWKFLLEKIRRGILSIYFRKLTENALSLVNLRFSRHKQNNTVYHDQPDRSWWTKKTNLLLDCLHLIWEFTELSRAIITIWRINTVQREKLVYWSQFCVSWYILSYQRQALFFNTYLL